MAWSDVRIRTLPAASSAVARLYPDQAPFVFVAPRAWHEGGSDPLRSVSVFAHPAGHLHYVGVGLEEACGAGCELSFRLAGASPGAIPSWPVRFMNEFARHAVRRARPFGPGHYLCVPEPVDPAGVLRCGALVPDPQLAGDPERPAWLQIVGLRDAELRAISEDGHQRLLAELARTAPLLETALERLA